jgi:superfamily II DNA or RNA helicase
MRKWGGTDSDVAQTIETISAETLAAYREAPRFVEEHANLERAAIEGGYGRRQLFELVQNGADEMLDEPGRIEVVLTPDALYCANQGRPLSEQGVGALLSSYRSPKRGVEIGRFGLGFKSVLAVTRQPAIFSESGSIGFDPDDARERIETVVGEVGRVPLLRIGRALDPKAARAEDATLADLMAWATTVVRLPRDVEDDGLLATQIKTFPAQFLLFAPHVRELVLRDVDADVSRTVRAKGSGEDLELVEDSSASQWKVFSLRHTPSERARRDAGAMADRDVIPLVWAVPRRRRGVGEFWAFFPTSERTTLSGVINAPWKLNEDRTRLIDGPFNRELLEQVSVLVLERAPELCDPADPGVLLDLMVGRGREARGDADQFLTDEINGLAKVSPSIPDQDGELELPTSLEIHPAEVPRRVLDLWAAQPTRPSNWAHPSVDSTERRATALRYKEPGRAASLRSWLEALISTRDAVAGSRAAIAVAAALVRAEKALHDQVADVEIVLDADGNLRSPSDPNLFLPAALPVKVETRLVHPDLLSQDEDRAALETLGVREVDAYRILEGRLASSELAGWSDNDWDLFWSLVRKSAREHVAALLERSGLDRRTIRVRTRAGEWHPIISVLLPGEIVGSDSQDDRTTIDTGYHADERQLLELLGAVRGPTEKGGSVDEPLFRQYRAAVRKAYLKKVASMGRPGDDYLDFRRRQLAGPLSPLTTLSPRARVLYTTALLSVAGDLQAWSFGHRTQERWPEIGFRNPVAQAIRDHGIIRTSLGARTVNKAVGPTFGDHAAVLPVASCSTAAARALGLPLEPGELSDEHWTALLSALDEADSDRALGDGYALAASNEVAPPAIIRCRVGHAHDSRGPELVVVTSDGELARLFADTATPFISVRSSADAQALVDRWGLRPDTDTVTTEVSWLPAGEPVALADQFPMLRLRLDPLQRKLLLQPANELKVERFTNTGRVSAPQPVVLHGDTVFHAADLAADALLARLSATLSLDLSPSEIDGIVRNLDAQRIRRLRGEIRKAKDDPGRLLLAIGAEELRSHLPRTLIEAVEHIEGELDERGIAELALIVHGPQVLQEHKDELERRGLEPPVQWAGSRTALEFARDLGFGPEYGGFERRRLERYLEVDGPPKLGDLHDFQEVVVDEIGQVLRGAGGLRGLLSLPTGAGKTRVTIEALVKAMKAGQLGSPVLWVAQTEELCEQAVQAWSEVWRAHGPRERLRLSRLWSSFEADQVERGHQVVVATIQKLAAGVYEKPSYAWLSRATCVVVDEAHQSVGTQYTELLEWQGMPRNQDRVPVIGLTATPFRGVNVEETRRLIRRYGARRLDTPALGDRDAYTALQDMGILAHVDQETLPGSEIELSIAELEQLTRMRQLPDRPIQELARDVGRNRTLLESIGDLDDDWPVLLFALSVEHAHTMAALLMREGISAAAISGETDRALRRHYIDRFRAGELRVITNFNVLTAGFDAPRVQALYVARPVYAPNTYQQMIGRGLRGPKNGGTDRCLLVNVADNVAQFGGQLAFHYFDYLWNGGNGHATQLEGDGVPTLARETSARTPQ